MAGSTKCRAIVAPGCARAPICPGGAVCVRWRCAAVLWAVRVTLAVGSAGRPGGIARCAVWRAVRCGAVRGGHCGPDERKLGPSGVCGCGHVSAL